MKINRYIPICLMLALSLLLSLFGVKPNTKAYAAEVGPDILITEIMPKSSSTEDAYEYIELYNNTDDNIDIKDYKFAYPDVDISSHKTISPNGTIILCTHGATTLNSFNSFYGTSLGSDKFMALPLSHDALNSTSDQCIILCEDDGEVLVCATYDSDDVETRKSITYKYPEDGFYMDMLARKQVPTIGTISDEQVPYNGTEVTGITLNKSVLTMEVGQTYKLKPSITPSTAANKSVKWNSSDTSIASVNTGGLVTAKSEGTAVIRVKTVDGGYSASCTILVTKIPVKDVELDRTDIKMDIGEAVILTAEISPSSATNQSVTWSSSDNKVASVDSDGMVLAKSEGECVIKVKTNDGGYTACCTVTVDEEGDYVHVSGITLNKSSITMDIGDGVALKASIKPYNADNKTVKWSSSNKDVASVDQNGVVYGKDAGRATITAKTVDGGFTDTCKVTVTDDESDEDHEVDNVKLNKFLLIMGKDGSEKLTATVLPSNASNKDVTWSSDNTSVARVDDDGNVTAIDKGIAVITVKTEDGNHTDRCIVVVLYDYGKYREIFDIRLNRKTLRISKGETQSLNVIFTPGNALKTDLTWSSSNSKIAEVSDDGEVTGLKEGKAIITVTTEDGDHKDSCIVYVEKAKDKGRGNGKSHWKWHF